MKLYNDRNKIIKLFQDKNIKPYYDYPYNAKFKESEEEKSEPEYEESIGETAKLRRQKKMS